MRRLANGTEDCDQGCAAASQNGSDEGEASEGLFEKEGRESGIEDEPGLTWLAGRTRLSAQIIVVPLARSKGPEEAML